MNTHVAYQVADWLRGQIRDVCEHYQVSVTPDTPVTAYCTPILVPSQEGEPRSELHTRLIQLAREAQVEVVARFADGYHLTHVRTGRMIVILLVDYDAPDVRSTAMRATL